MAATQLSRRGKPTDEFVLKVQNATRQAMDEAIHLSEHHIRWENVDSMIFRRQMEADPDAFETTGAVYAIRDRLRRVAEELGATSKAATHLDSILDDLAARKQAENELDQDLRL